jgi:hypothetical protein
MGRFEENAAKILDIAERGAECGLAPSGLTILIGSQGGLHLVAGNDWPLHSLQMHYGAQMAYRVSQHGAAVRVEGRAGSRTCVFESEKPELVARNLLSALPGYVVIESAGALAGA